VLVRSNTSTNSAQRGTGENLKPIAIAPPPRRGTTLSNQRGSGGLVGSASDWTLNSCIETMRCGSRSERSRSGLSRLRVAPNDLDRSLIDLRVLFDAVEADLGRQFDGYRTRFASPTFRQSLHIGSPIVGRRKRRTFRSSSRMAFSSTRGGRE